MMQIFQHLKKLYKINLCYYEAFGNAKIQRCKLGSTLMGDFANLPQI